MSILVTRPEPGASRTLAALARSGLGAISAPLFEVVMTGAVRPTGKFAALIVTSANGAAGLSPASADLAADISVFAVGDRTAEAVRLAGFTQVSSASGDNRALAKLVAASIAPKYRLLLASGEDHKDALPAALTRAGFEIALWTRYRSVPLGELPAVARDGLRDGTITSVLHYSRRAAETFVALATSAGLAGRIPALTHHVLSPDVAEPLALAGCTDIQVAASPTEEQLLALLMPLPAAKRDQTLPVRGPERIGRPAAMLVRTEQVTEPMATPPDSASNGHPAAENTASGNPASENPASQASLRAVPRSRKAAVGPVAAPALHAMDDLIASQQPDRMPDQPSGIGQPEPQTEPPTVLTPEPSGQTQSMAARRNGMSPPVIIQKGTGWAGLAALSLVSGLIGATAIVFFAPVLNSVGIRLPNSPTLALVDTRLSKLEGTRPQAAIGATADPALQAGISAVTAQAAQLRLELEAIDRRMTELAARPATVAAPGAAAPGAASPGAASPQLAELQQQVEQSSRMARDSAAAAQALGPRLADMERSNRSAGAPGLAATGAARLIIADRIARAVSDGRPFAQEAAALGAMGTAPEPLRALTAVSQAGVPTLGSLRTGLAPVRQQAVSSPPADASWSDWLMGLMSSVVRVRNTGAGQGQSPLAIINRIDQSLQGGDAVAAVALFAQLPEPARRAGAGWLEAATRRASADTALKTITDDAVKAMSGVQ